MTQIQSPRGVTHSVSPKPEARVEPERSFGDALREHVHSLSELEQRTRRHIRRAGRRAETSPQELLVLQAEVYRYSQEVELASKLVDKASSGVRTVLQSQQ